eukprot:TRINITY_DN8585_c0_g1_i4.p1 TRINITY_DN8585_c0_g1~~TRINITY_DN8585_c0_g1_i4.p1  ORF type:complete len:472 (+),score=103.75 TRINITY_DN8585_c0_g1_i4:129-1544(+)
MTTPVSPSPLTRAVSHPLAPSPGPAVGPAPTTSPLAPPGSTAAQRLRPGVKPFGSRASVNLEAAEVAQLGRITAVSSIPANMDAMGAPHDSALNRSASTPQMAEMEDAHEPVAVMGSKPRLAPEDVTPDEAGVRKLMQAGAWRSVLKIADRCIASSNHPPQILQFKLCRIVALVKMKMMKNAQDEITGIGDFNDPSNCYEAYPQLAPRRGSMIPWSMRVIKAELAFALGADQSLDPLYNLLSSCRREIERLKTESPELSGVTDQLASSFITADEVIYGGGPGQPIATWFKREARLMFQIATYLMQTKEYLLAIGLVEELCSRYPQDSLVLSCLARMHLQMGNIRAANMVFKRAEQLYAEPEKSVVCLMNKGYLALSVDQYSTAIEHFQAVLDIQPNNIAAANNRAICWLYTTDLSRAISSLEEVLMNDPENTLDESLVFNLSIAKRNSYRIWMGKKLVFFDCNQWRYFSSR